MSSIIIALIGIWFFITLIKLAFPQSKNHAYRSSSYHTSFHGSFEFDGNDDLDCSSDSDGGWFDGDGDCGGDD